MIGLYVHNKDVCDLTSSIPNGKEKEYAPIEEFKEFFKICRRNYYIRVFVSDEIYNQYERDDEVIERLDEFFNQLEEEQKNEK